MAEAEAEDEEELAQWMPICDDCDNPVEHYCTTCGDKLCSGCKNNHLASRRYRDHQVVPYNAGMRASKKSTSTCTKHPGERYSLYCNPCQLPVCALCIAQAHADHNHTFLSISDAYYAAKVQATSLLQKLTRDIRPRVTEYSSTLQNTATEALQSVGESEQAVRKTAKQLTEVVSLLLDENLKQISELKENKILPALKKQEQCRDDNKKKVDEAIKEYEDSLRSEDPVDLLVFMKGKDQCSLDTAFTVPVIDAIPKMTIRPVSISKETMQTYFEPVTLSDKQIVVKEDEEAMNVKKAEVREKETNGKRERDPQQASLRTFRNIMRNPELQTELIADANIGRIAKLRCFKAEMLGLLGCNQGKIDLVNNSGNRFQTIDTDCTVDIGSGMCISYDAALIFVDQNKKQVQKVSQNYHVTTVFTTKGRPYGISQLQSGDLVVCMANEGILRVYDGAGKVVRVVGKGNLQRPFYVAVNKVNDDICVSDSDRHITVLRSSGEKRFTYTGDSTGFNPLDLCCDQLGNILVTDTNNHRVHIIDSDGLFLQYLVYGRGNIFRPVTIDIDGKGYAWVGEWNTGKVEAYKYLQ